VKLICTCLLILSGYTHACGQKITDTIFYNSKWEICEQPIADYYRIGTLAIDSFWFFTGNIKDYTTDNVLVMNGNYSIDGYKNGYFEFYYPNGKPMLKGYYKNDKMIGLWDFYYDNGNPKATIYLPENNNDFIFLKFTDNKGKVLLENGSGDFHWRQNELEPAQELSFYDYQLFGTFKDSLRDDTWKYYIGEEVNINWLRYKEFYKKGALEKTKWVGNSSQKVESSNVVFNFQPLKINTTERIAYDEFLSKRDSFGRKGDDNFMNYLINGESPGISLQEKEFSKSLQSIINTLDNYRYKIDYENKDIQGEVEFKIAGKGTPEDVTVKGNISNKEQAFIKYIMSKFKGIEMPLIDSNIAVEGYHKFYFFTFNPRPLMPADMGSYLPKKDFIFFPVPKDKFLVFAKDLKKDIRKIYNRRFF